ncbi:hypothetical protein QJS10_CPA16g00565 [Acorus calamus]|uniref:Large ribosomal subunit protein uL30 N-terminal eukaryotes domain-containing protein n=1 Tax=Acorus calamus TaxID=4465 RepID=A0AAV9D386_ACOCL|nr:hypothetical protein QJS10_CPA16g00565 [Acorus calamus]
METAKVIPKSVLKKRKRCEEWSLVKKAAETAKKKRSTDWRLIFKRAEQYAKEYDSLVTQLAINVMMSLQESDAKYDTDEIIKDVIVVTEFSVGGCVVNGYGKGVKWVKIIVDGQLRAMTDSQGIYKLDQIKFYTVIYMENPVTLTHGPKNVKPQVKQIDKDGWFCFEREKYEGKYHFKILPKWVPSKADVRKKVFVDIRLDRPIR